MCVAVQERAGLPQEGEGLSQSGFSWQNKGSRALGLPSELLREGSVVVTPRLCDSTGSVAGVQA